MTQVFHELLQGTVGVEMYVGTVRGGTRREVQEGRARGSVLPLSPLSSSPVSHLE